jgi:hypothetical protein
VEVWRYNNEKGCNINWNYRDTDDATIKRLEKEWGKPIKKIEKDGNIILLVGRGLFKKKIVIPFKK